MQRPVEGVDSAHGASPLAVTGTILEKLGLSMAFPIPPGMDRRLPRVELHIGQCTTSSEQARVWHIGLSIGFLLESTENLQ